MSMKDLVVSISIRQKDPHDAMSESQEKLARKVYKKRINSWQDYFVKVCNYLHTSGSFGSSKWYASYKGKGVEHRKLLG